MQGRGRTRKSWGRTSPAPSALLALVVGNVALAFGAWFVRMADVGPVAAGFWRIALAAPVLLVLARAIGGAGALRVPRPLWVGLILSGLFFAGDLAAWHVGILRTTLANATLFGNTATLMFPIYGFLIARAWPNRSQAVALGIAAIGAGLLMGRSYDLDPRNFAGDLFCLGAGLLYTGFFILMARARATLAPLPALAWSSLASLLPLLVAALLGERVWPGDWTGLLLLAFFSQVVGQGCMIYALGLLPPLVLGIGLLIQPVVAALVGMLVYDERLGTLDLIGAVLVAAALVLVRRQPVAKAAPGPNLVIEEER